MDPVLVGLAVFVCAFGGAVVGMAVGSRLPEAHRNDGSKDTIKIGIGLVATMTALILGLITASAKGSFDAVDHAVRRASASVLTLDRDLARYGPEAAPLRAELKDAIKSRIAAMFPEGDAAPSEAAMWEQSDRVEALASKIRTLQPKDEDQRWLRARALDLAESLLEVRFQVFSSTGAAVQLPFLAVLVFWLTLTFGVFGLFAPRNVTVISVLMVCALSVAAAVFLVLEMDGPFHGVIRVSARPLFYALDHLGR